MPTISIIVPVYNSEQYLSTCIDSILAQTFEDFELILVDDGSDDNSPAICDAYVAKDARISVIHQDNQGQSAARNHATAIAKGSWVCFVDSDDVIHPQMLEFLRHAAMDHNVDISMCSVLEDNCISNEFLSEQVYTATAIKINESTMSELYEYDKYRPWIVCGKLIRKDIVLQIPFTEGRIYEDNAVVCQWLVKADTVADLNTQLYFYRINPSGTTKRAFQIKHLDYLWALEEMVSFFKKCKYSSLYSRYCTSYLVTSTNYYWRVKNELHLAETALNIKKKMHKFYYRNRCNIILSDSQKRCIYEVLFSRTMCIYWLYKSGTSTIKQDGVLAFIHKAFNFLCRGKRK